jgi:hypothetical protein
MFQFLICSVASSIFNHNEQRHADSREIKRKCPSFVYAQMRWEMPLKALGYLLSST